MKRYASNCCFGIAVITLLGFGGGFYSLQQMALACSETKEVSLEPKSWNETQTTPNISPNICLNAQSEYRIAKFVAHVQPSGTSATVSVDATVNSGPVTVSPSTVTEGAEVTVTAKESAASGQYRLQIVHDLNASVTNSADGSIFSLGFASNHLHTVPETVGTGFVNENIPSVSGKSTDVNSKNGAYIKSEYEVLIQANPAVFAGNVKSAFNVQMNTTGITGIEVKRLDVGLDSSPIKFKYELVEVDLQSAKAAGALEGKIVINNAASVLTSQLVLSSADLPYWIPWTTTIDTALAASRGSELMTFAVGTAPTTAPVDVELTAASESDNDNLQISSCYAGLKTFTVTKDANSSFQIIK